MDEQREDWPEYDREDYTQERDDAIAAVYTIYATPVSKAALDLMEVYYQASTQVRAMMLYAAVNCVSHLVGPRRLARTIDSMDERARARQFKHVVQDPRFGPHRLARLAGLFS